MLPGAVFVFSFAAYALTISRTLWTTDVFGADWTSWHIARTGSPWIDGTRIPELGHRSAALLAIVQTDHGHTAFGRFPGSSWRASRRTPCPGRRASAPCREHDGGVTACAQVLMLRAVRGRQTDTQAAIASLVLGVATHVWTVSANLMWS